MKWTNETIGQLKLVSYERTKAEAQEAAKDHEVATGRKCVVFGNGRRARKWTYDKPWQVREIPLTEREMLIERLEGLLSRAKREGLVMDVETIREAIVALSR